MSNIQKVLATATEIEPSKRSNETIADQAYLKRLVMGVQDLVDAAWEGLSREAQDWYNSAIDAIEQKKDIPAFPDMEPPADATSSRRRGSAATPEVVEAVAMASIDAKKGDKVNVTTKRGKVYAGEVVEADKQGIVLDVDGKDVELDHDKIDKISLQGGAGVVEPVDDTPAAPEVGDTVQVVTKRGKNILGNVVEMGDSDVVIKDAGGEVHELSKDRLESIVVKVKNGRPAANKAVAETTKATASPDKPANTRTTAAVNGGISITTRIREIVADNLEAKKDAVAAVLKKEGLEFKQATLDLTYSDMHKIISILRDRKIIK